MTVHDRVRTFIIEDLGYDGSSGALADDLPIIDLQIVDSMGLYEVVSLLEQEYGLTILDEEVLPTNFGSIDSIGRFVADKLRAEAAAV